MSDNFANIADNILMFLSEAVNLLPRPFETPYEHVCRLRGQSFGKRNYYNAIYGLKKRGVIAVVEKNNKRFIALTKKGQLEILLSKVKLIKTKSWDGRWRIVMFDIPEDFRGRRNVLRRFLKGLGFYKLQASVFINPYPMNREAVRYLQTTGLIEFIRMIRTDEVDNDKDLRKKFNL